jgi:hypothetical protein
MGGLGIYLIVYCPLSLVWAVFYCKAVYARNGDPPLFYAITLVFAPVFMPVMAMLKAFELFCQWISTPFKRRGENKE